MNKKSCILIINQNDVIGSSISKKLVHHDYEMVLETNDLVYTNKKQLKEFIFATKPEYVFISNVDKETELNIIELSIQVKAKSIVNYIRLDDDKSYLEKYKGDIISILIDEVYGDFDDYNYETCHILPEMLRKIHEAKAYNIPNVYLWIPNNRKLNLIYNDDLANVSIQVADNYEKGCIVDLRTGSSLNVKSLGGLIKEQLEYNGEVIYIDNYKYNYDKIDYGRPIKRLDWMPKITIKQGVRLTYTNLLDQKDYFFISKIF